jgi:sulfate transport system ATP-binding protein
VFVTHDQEEALEVADRVVVMDRGRIEQAGTPQEVYEQPATAFVNEFIGETIVMPVEIDAGAVRYEGALVPLNAPGIESGPARLFVRPYEMAIIPPSEAPFRGTVRRVHGLGPGRRVEIALGASDGETVIEIDAARTEQLTAGQCVGLEPRQYRIFASA